MVNRVTLSACTLRNAMKFTKSRSLIYFAILVSFVALLIFYALTYKNLQKTLGQTEDEKVVLKMMYHLDRLQISFTEIESNAKPFLILRNRNKAKDYQNASSAVNLAMTGLKSLCGSKNIPCPDILILDSFLEKQLFLLDSVVSLTLHEKQYNAIELLNSKPYAILENEVIERQQGISDIGREKLRMIQEERNVQSRSIYSFFAFIIFVTVILLVFIFWRLIKQTTSKDRLLSQNKLYEDIINNSSESITVTDTELRLTFCNKATEDLFKKSQEEIIGKNVDDAFGTILEKGTNIERLEALKKQGYWKSDIIRRDAEANKIDIHLSVNSIRDQKGITTGYFAIQTNISDLKKAQREVEEMALHLKKSNEILEERVKEQTSLLIETFDRVKAGFIATDADLTINYYNNILLKLLGIHERDISGKKLTDILLPSFGREHIQIIQDAFTEQEEKHFEFLYARENRWYRASIFPSVNGVSIYLTDVTVRKKATEELEKSHRLYQFISEVNNLIIHAKTKDEISAEICKIAVNSGGLSFAWIGINNLNTNLIEPIAWAGREEGYIDVVKKISTQDIPEGRGPSGSAIREGKYYYSNDIELDPAMSLWRIEALSRGYRSSIALPVKVNEKVGYVFTLYASKTFFFTDDEVTLLVNVVGNVGQAFSAFDNNAKRIAAEKQLRKVLQAVEQSSASIVITDLKGDIEYVNPAFSKLTGYSYEEAMGKNPRILKSGYTADAEYSGLWNDITNDKEWQGIFRNKKKNGEYYWEYAIISPIHNEEGQITNYVAVKENITGRKALEDEQKQLTRIIENTDAYVAIADINRNVLYGNKALRNVLEIGEDEDIFKYNLAEFRTEKGAQIIKEANEIILKEGKWSGENYYKSKSGIEIPVLQVIVLHKNENGEPVHISTTAIDLSKVKKTEQELLLLNNELRDFSLHLQKISESEKQQIARDIHDELGQNLTLLKFGISWIKKHLGDDTAIIDKKVDELLDEITITMDSFRRIQTSLHPAMLEELGLSATLEWLLNSFSKSSEIEIKFSVDDIDKEVVNLEKSLVIYRIAQESLTNIKRYANAENVSFKLMREDNMLLLSIADNGRGFDITTVDTKTHHGILGMRERVYAMQGEFSIHSVIGEGTYINAKIPID